MGNNLDRQYLDLLQDILDNGVKKTDRTGTGTISVFGRQIRHKMSEGIPVLTTKKIAWNSMVVELLWFMKGRTDLKYLLDHDCKIWVGDAYKVYEKWFWDNIPSKADTSGKLTHEQFVYNIKNDPDFSNNFGELGPIYGKQWRAWEKHVWDKIDFDTRIEYVDQIQNLVNDLKTNPDSRRLMVSAWNPSNLDSMVLPPCHYGFQVYTRELSLEERRHWWNRDVEKENYRSLIYDQEELDENNVPVRSISLMFNMRSTDVPLGLPFNLASYGLLLSIIAKEVKMIPDELIANLGDTHIYLNQIDGVQEQLGKELSLEERRSMVTQEMFNMVYNGGDPSSLSHREIDQWGIPRRLERKPYDLPKLVCLDEYHYLMDDDISFSEKIEKFRPEFFKLQDYKCHPAIKFPLSN
jgi:thymidylate synthase